MERYEDSAVFNPLDVDARHNVQEGFLALRIQMQEYFERAEKSDECRASEESVRAELMQRHQRCQEMGISSDVDLSESAVLQKARDEAGDLIRLNGIRIMRIDEIRELQAAFDGNGQVAEEIVEKTMVLFRQLTLRSVLQVISADHLEVRTTSRRIHVYAAAYAALSTADPGSEIWYPFDEFLS